MHAAMNIGVVRLVVARDCVDHRSRLLRCGGVVEINERLAVNFPLEDWKIGANSLYVDVRLFALRTSAGCRSASSLLAAVVIRFLQL